MSTSQGMGAALGEPDDPPAAAGEPMAAERPTARTTTTPTPTPRSTPVVTRVAPSQSLAAQRFQARRRGSGDEPPGPRAPITKRPVGQRRLSVRVIIALFVLAIVVAAAVWALFFSSLLATRTVEVHGLSTIDRQTVLDVAHVDLGTPLARLDTGTITVEVATIPAVAHVDVTRQWPHTVVVTITERVPAIAVPQPDGTYAVYDSTGVRFLTTATAPAGIAQLHADNAPSAEVVTAVLQVVRALPPSLSQRLTTVRADSLDGIKLALDSGAVTVVWGSAENSAHKAEVLVPLMANPAAVYDVSAPDVPTTRN